MGIAERKELEKQKMRKLILKTAMKLFLEEGFENITIRRIAEKIEYSPATIYLYFKDKDEILYTLHNEGFEKLYRLQLKTLSIKDPLERLREQGEMYISFALENPEFYDLMFMMRGPAKKITEKKERDIGMRSYEFLRENVKECMEEGLLPEANVDIAAFSMWSHVHGIASLIIRDRCTTFSEEQIDYFVKGSLNFMLNGILNKAYNLNYESNELKVGGNR